MGVGQCAIPFLCALPHSPMAPIVLPLQPIRASPAQAFFSKRNPPKPDHESDLLKSIRIALKGSEASVASAVHSTVFLSDDDGHSEEGEEELTWDDDTVILSKGGIIHKKWCLREEKQNIQWACLGWFREQPRRVPKPPGPGPKNASAADPTYPSASGRPTFGPFSHAQALADTPPSDSSAAVPAVYVFLRGIGKIYLKNGVEYTFAIPFVVRRAWPLSPFGVMIQRVLEPSEIEEAELSGDDLLPTLFSLTSPFSEIHAVGVTNGIIGRYKTFDNGLSVEAGDQRSVPRLKDCETALKSIKNVHSKENVVHVTHRCPASEYEVFVTVDEEKRQLSVWRYVYMKPNDTPVPFERARLRRKNRHKRTESVETDDYGNTTTTTHDPTTDEDSASDDGFPEPHFPPTSSGVPGLPTSLATTTTLQSLLTTNTLPEDDPFGPAASKQPSTKPPSKAEHPKPLSQAASKTGITNTTTTTKFPPQAVAGPGKQSEPRSRRNSLTRNELSVTMDRMALVSRTDHSTGQMEHEKMKPSIWVQRLYSTELSEAE
jgi:anaphase-promoting complex subunit 1